MLHKMVCRNTPVFVILFLSIAAFLAYPAASHASDIAGAEYFFDNDPGEGNGISLPAADSGFDSPKESVDHSEIDTSFLTIGNHTLYVRFISADGLWGMARPVSLDPFFRSPYNFRITGEKWIAGAEYFIDDDPGAGFGIPLLATDGEFNGSKEELELPDIDISSLSTGIHTLYLRLKDNEGTWGVIRKVAFEIYEPETIDGAEYFVDNDPGPGNGTPLSAKDGGFDSTEEQVEASGIDVSGLSEGIIHTLYVRYKDRLDRWGAPFSQTFAVDRPVAYTSSPITQPATGDGRIPLSVVVADQSASNTCRLKVEYALDDSDDWQQIRIEEGSVSATYGSPILNNGAEYQVGGADGWIETGSGPNTVSFVWVSREDLRNFETKRVRLRFILHNGMDEHVTSTESEVFSLDNMAPGIPVPIHYTPDPTGDATPMLTWNKVFDVDNYHLQIATDATFGDIVVDESDITTISFTPSSPLPHGDIYWRVSAVDKLGNESSFSIIDHFTIVADIDPPSVALSYSAPSPVSAGPLTITAFFSEPLATVPQIAIDQPGASDISPAVMTGNGAIWSYTYVIQCADSIGYMDGTATVTISNGFDYAGNENGSAQNNAFVINTSDCGSGNIMAAEYFFDIDPGKGNGVSLAAADGGFDSPEESVDLSSIDVSSLKIGHHTLYVRFMSADGVWGLTRPVAHDPDFTSPFNFRISGEKWLSAAEYFIDVDPGEGYGEPVPSVDGDFDEAKEELGLSGIDISHLGAGSHTLYVRVQNNEGIWGIIRQVTFEIYEPLDDTISPTPYNFQITDKKWIAAAEYFIDADPGVGHGEPVNAVDGEFDGPEENLDLSGIDISHLDTGLRTLYVRVKDNSDNWGIIRQVTFEIYELETIAGAEYFVDNDPGPGNGTPLSAKDGGFDSTEEQVEASAIDVSDLSEGIHTLYVRYKDRLDRWGAPFSQAFAVDRPVAYTSSPITQPATGDGRIPLSVVVADQSASNTCRLKVEYALDDSDDWQQIRIEEGSVSATYGTPLLDNNAEYQIGRTGGWIETESGANIVSFVWLSTDDLGKTDAAGVNLRLTIHNGTAEHVTSTESMIFSVDTQAPDVPILIPYAPDPTGDTTPVLAWNRIFGAGYYHLQVAADSAFANILLDQSDIALTSYVVQELLPYGDIYWQVSSVDEQGNESAFSIIDHFLIIEDADPPSVTLSYSTSFPVSAGPVTITALFSEPMATVPEIAIDQPGNADLSPTAMTGSGTTWAYTYTVQCADGSAHVDGTATVTISNGFDYAGNKNTPAQNNSFDIDTSACGSGNIIGAEYFFDEDPGKGNGVSLQAAGGAFDSPEESVDLSDIDTSSLSIGNHTLYVRFKNADGVWGIARPVSGDPLFDSPYNFCITGEKWIAGAEYFIDVDPGEGNAEAVSAIDGTFDESEEDLELSGIDVSYLAAGPHTLYLRVQDNEGTWGIVRQVSFEIYEAFTISGAEYFIDNDPGPGNGTPVSAKDGSFDSDEEQVDVSGIDTTGLIGGYHTLYVRFQDSLGHWGALKSTIFNVINDSDDQDGDGMPNGWEQEHGLNPLDPSDTFHDPDNDGLTNLEEYERFTDPHNPDSDGDSMPDGWEVGYGLDPTTDDSSSDQDNDGLTNGEEYLYRTDPTNNDTDSDGINDGDEVANGTNPRAMTSSLTSDTSDLTLSVGVNRTVILQIANKNRVSDTFDLSVTGIGADWYTLEQTQVILSAGEVRDVQLNINVPEDCGLTPLEYNIQVSAVSPDTGPVVNGGTNIQLNIVVAPVMSALLPNAGESLGTNSVQITWRTDVSATTEVHYRIAGTEEYIVVTGDAGRTHRIVLEDLYWDSTYEWYVVSSGPCEPSQTQLRTFFVRDGIVFEDKESSHDILRDYDQQISFTVQNQDIASHKVLVEVMNPHDDLIAGFVGSGSQDEEITLDAGEIETMILAVHAQDTKFDQYVLILKLTADADSDNPIVDYARATINVANPVFDLSFVEISSNPAILTNTYRITNNGDTITDLRVFAEEAIAPQILFQPKIDHARLQKGESMIFAATFQATDGVFQHTGSLTVEGAEQSVSITTHFGCPDGTPLYDVSLNDVHICLRANDWYCNNRPKIEVDFVIPRGITPENITRARLYMHYSLPWASNTYRKHDVTVKLNGVVIQNMLDTIPEGPYGIDIPPALIRTGTNSVGRNTVTLVTTHMNRGHYVVTSDFELILDVDSIIMDSVCAASQEEANLSAQDFPFLCDGQPAWKLCPRIDGVTPLDENGNVKWNFNPGETVQFRVTTVNPDLDGQTCDLNFIIDDDFNAAGTPFEQNRTFTMVPGGSHTETFWWEIPDAEARFYHTRAVVAGFGDCSNEKTTTNTIAINQPVVGQVHDNETSLGLEGVEVCAYGIGPISLYVDCTTTDQNGMFTLYLPDGNHAIFATKDGYSLDSVVVDTAGVSPLLSISHDSSHLGDEADSGYANDPVNTALGNFIHDHNDLSFKGRGLNFSFVRFYNSQDTYQGPLGYGWTHNYNINVNKDGSVAVIKFGDGHDEFYVRQADQSYKAQPGVHNTLTELPDGSFVLKDKAQTVHNFDADGWLISIVDKNGNTISLTYQDGRLVSVTDPVGRQVQFTYDAENRITQLDDPLGRTVRFAYDTNGDLVSSFDAMGSETKYTYDGQHQVLTATDSKGNVFVTNTYDAENRVVTAQSDALGNISRFDYDERNHQTTITDPLGNKTVHLHDSRNRLVKVIDPLRNTVAMEYDKDNNRTRVIDKRGNETLFEYDAQGNVTRIIDALAHETSIVYNDKNNPMEKTDALGHKTAFEYDDRGNLVKIIDTLLNQTTIVVNEFGQPTSVTDARNSVTQYTYGPQGNLIETRDALNYTVTIDYDAAGRIISVTDQRGHTTTFAYDANDNLTTTTDPAPFGYTVVNGYDLNGNRISVKDKRGYVTAFGYDQKNRIESVTDPLTHAVNYIYDALDRKISQTNERGKNTAFTYDTLGNLTAVTDALSNTVHNSYDANGNLTRWVDPMGRTISNTYDKLNRLVLTEDALGNHTEYSYDALSRVSAKTDANGRITRYEYDELGRLVKVIEPGNIETLFEYDEVGNKVGFTNGNGSIFTYEHDVLNRLTRDADGYQYEYDGAGNLTRRTDAKGQEIVYQYNELNRLTVVRYPDAGEVTFTYDPNGNQINMVDSLGATVKQYNELNRPTQTTDPFGKVVGFGYDESGNRTVVTYPDNSMVQYSYDDLNRLQAVTDWADRITAYSYDNSGRLVDMTYPNGSTAALSYDDVGRLKTLANNRANNDIICNYSFTLDPVGNRTQVDKTEPLGPFIKDASITYQYDADNRITAITDGAVTFDANGSVTSRTKGPRTFNFSWNFENRLQQIDDGTHTVTHLYDGRNNRLASIRNGVTTRYVLDTGAALSSILAETDEGGNIIARYIYGLGLIAKEDDQGVHYYHYDPQGSTIALSDDSGEITDKYAYDPFGGLANRAGSTENPFTFVGQFGLMDEGNGLYYVRARYYDSIVGRFLNRDLVLGDDTDPRSLHQYVYVMNRPVGMVDVSGLCGEDEFPWKEIKWRLNDIKYGSEFVRQMNRTARWLNRTPYVPRDSSHYLIGRASYSIGRVARGLSDLISIYTVVMPRYGEAITRAHEDISNESDGIHWERYWEIIFSEISAGSLQSAGDIAVGNVDWVLNRLRIINPIYYAEKITRGITKEEYEKNVSEATTLLREANRTITGEKIRSFSRWILE